VRAVRNVFDFAPRVCLSDTRPPRPSGAEPATKGKNTQNIAPFTSLPARRAVPELQVLQMYERRQCGRNSRGAVTTNKVATAEEVDGEGESMVKKIIQLLYTVELQFLYANTESDNSKIKRYRNHEFEVLNEAIQHMNSSNFIAKKNCFQWLFANHIH
jgi:hypothetical protein